MEESSCRRLGGVSSLKHSSYWLIN